MKRIYKDYGDIHGYDTDVSMFLMLMLLSHIYRAELMLMPLLRQKKRRK